MQRPLDWGSRRVTYPRILIKLNYCILFVPLGSVGQMLSRQAEPALDRTADLHAGYWNVRTLQDVCVQATTMWELRQYQINNACLSEVRITDSCRSVDDYFHLQNSQVVDHSGRHSVAITIIKACQATNLCTKARRRRGGEGRIF